ncbi:hypothetical protein ACPW96_19125 [Micromonospora sp. DT81.3]|uniref:hypothetical protein n=1 Tax=Micromonospora sp. DT81.3 TaxID=3416523 RepID=UPI003CF02951
MPPRSFRAAIRPERVILAVLAIAAIVAGFVLGALRDFNITGLVVLGLGTAALFAAVLFPAIRDIEFGFPSGIRVSTALRDREQELFHAFTSQRGDFTLYAQLLCADPAVAAALLEAAWAKTAAEWRGPVTPHIRAYVMCVFVHLVESHERWTEGPSPDPPAPMPPSGSLSSLTLAQRTVVVLREFAELPLAQVASITERPLEDIAADLRSAQAIIGGRSIEGGGR